MEVKILPHLKNSFPFGGFFIRNASVIYWIKEIQLLKLSLSEITVYPIPDLKPNSIWGCLVLLVNPEKVETGKHERCQCVLPGLFIPEKSRLFPAVTLIELQKIFSKGKYAMHPDVGLVELSEEWTPEQHIVWPQITMRSVVKPETSINRPARVRSFQIQASSPDEILKNLSESLLPGQERLKDEPLNVLEKVRLGFYKMIFTKSKGEGNGTIDGNAKLPSRLENFFAKLFNSIGKLDKLQKDFEDLDKRNQKQIDRLMDMFKNDPDNALKYAIPLDDQGITRGGSVAKLDLTMRWFDFSLSGNNRQSGSGTVDLGDNFYQLQNQYNSTAEELLKRKEYKKAAFVYLKLLKNYAKAADSLESGQYYQEAATIHLKHTRNELKAAQCYEKGNMTMDAINLYKKLGDNEKVGDLFMSISNRPEAMVHYEKVVESFKLKNQYVKASLIYKEKMNDASSGQALLMQGWKGNTDAINCLNNYFNNIHDVDLLANEINTVYRNEVTDKNRVSFLRVIQYEFKKDNKLQESLREIAFEIVADEIVKDPSVVSELKEFNPRNKELMKDTLRFKFNNRPSKL